MTMRFHITLQCLMLLLLVSCNTAIEVSSQKDQEAIITPDYKDVTIPANIAPLNFQVQSDSPAVLIINDTQGESFQVKSDDEGLFSIPQKKWKSLLSHNKGSDITFQVCLEEDGKWVALRPFAMHVAQEDLDSYLAYRLVQPGYTFWNRMGLYQRNLETYEQTPIYENQYTDYNCVNCHSFPARNPEKMTFHMRAKSAGTVMLQGNKLEKLNTKTDETISALVYPYWHPSENYMAFSVNDTKQAFFAHSDNILEVFDNASDVVIYDVNRHEVFSSPLLKSEDAFETFPTFSPDGKSLYFCSAVKVDSLPLTYKDVHYSLCRIDVDVEHRTFGTKVDTLYNAVKDGRSVSFPRISPDGRFMAVTLHEAGNFSIWHPEADLYLIDLQSGEMRPLTEANSPDTTDSYHSWSSNGRWLVFSSRRMDGLYTRPFFTYIDEDGHAHKPFVLPQKDPVNHYEDLFYSYNIPEFVSGKVNVNQHSVATMMKDTEGINAMYAKN